MPRDSGVTSRSRTSLTSPLSTPACRAAPTATTSSGLTPLLGSLPPVSSLTRSVTAGIRVEPPTRITWSILSTSMPASLMTDLNGSLVRSSRSDGHPLELAAGELLLEVQRAGLAVGDVGQVDRGLARRGQLDLRLLRGLLQPLLGDLVGAEVDAVAVLELLDHPLDQALVPVVTAEVVVTARWPSPRRRRRRSRAGTRRTCHHRGRRRGWSGRSPCRGRRPERPRSAR